MAPLWLRRAAATPMDDDEANDCGICFLPFDREAPPAFQCDAGHVICSPCRDMLELPAGRCHVCCGKAACRGSRRAHGRDLWPDYYGPKLRSRARRGSCRCPVEGCIVARSTAELLCHFVSEHDWPVTNGVFSGDTIAVRLRDGVNVVAVDCRGDPDDDDRDITGRYLVVMEVVELEVEDETVGRTVSAFCVRPRGASFWSDQRCHLGLSYSRNIYANDDDTLVQCYYQTTDASIACTDLARGLPDRDLWFKTNILRSVDLDDNEETVEVNLRTIIH